MLQRFKKRWSGRREKKLQSVLDKAEAALADKKYDRVNTLVIPYLVHHAHDTRAYMLLGRAALEQQSWEEALVFFSEVVNHDPNHTWGWAMLGFTAMNAGKYTIALSCLQRARDQHPDNVAILESLLLIAQRIDSDALRKSVEKDLMKIDPQTYKKTIEIENETDSKENAAS